MSLNLSDLIKKAKDRGLGDITHQALRPWQQESTLFLLKEKAPKSPTKSWQQTDNKPTTNRQQIGNRGNKPTTNWQQTGNKLAIEATTNRQQTDNKPTTETTFYSLVGLQRSLVFLIYNQCKITRSKTTEKLTLEHISKIVNTTTGSVKTTLQRLEAKNLIERITYKNGRGGWSQYSIPNQYFQEILQYEINNKLATNWQQTGNKSIAQPTTRNNSSSSIYNKTTTTSNPQTLNECQLSSEWQNLDIEPLVSIGFTDTHLSQIASQDKLTAEVTQDSIYAFAFDLQKNDKAKSIKGDPINFFMGILRKGGAYTFPSNYESFQDKAMRLYLERMSEIEQKRDALEKKTKDLAYKEWFAQLSDEQKIELIPTNLRSNARLENNKILEGGARAYFEKEIWPSKKVEIVKKEDATEK